MPDLGPQFKDFQFSASPLDPDGTTNVVAYYRDRPVGSLSISPPVRSRGNAEEQESINDREGSHYSMYVDEGDILIEGQLPGQRQWAGGAFERDYPAKVSWVGMDTSDLQHSGVSGALTAKALSRMMAIGLAHHTALHGEMPRADSALSDDGAAISRGMRRKYGMKAHPANPRMDATFGYDDDDGVAAVRGSAKWHDQIMNSHRRGGGVRDYTSDQADEVHRQMDEQYNLKKIGPDPETDPDAHAAWEAQRNRRPGRGQMSLF